MSCRLVRQAENGRPRASTGWLARIWSKFQPREQGRKKNIIFYIFTHIEFSAHLPISAKGTERSVVQV